MTPTRYQVIAKWKGIIKDTSERVFRLTIADLPADDTGYAGVFTILEERGTDALGAERWTVQQMYSRNTVDPALECLIDIIGRPEWDTRPRTQLI